MVDKGIMYLNISILPRTVPGGTPMLTGEEIRENVKMTFGCATSLKRCALPPCRSL